jgi:hypothetical protein
LTAAFPPHASAKRTQKSSQLARVAEQHVDSVLQHRLPRLIARAYAVTNIRCGECGWWLVPVAP